MRLALPAHAVAALAAGALAAAPAAAQPIDFEDFVAASGAMPNAVGAPVPLAARLSDWYLAARGVRFGSGGGYVAVVDLGVGHARSGAYGIGGSTAAGTLSYASPFFISFYDVATGGLATTDSFGILGDTRGDGSAVTALAWGADGTLLASQTLNEGSGSLAISFAQAGIHRIEIRGSQTVAFDDVRFGDLVAVPPASVVPEPAPTALVSTGLAGMGLLVLRRTRRRPARA